MPPAGNSKTVNKIDVALKRSNRTAEMKAAINRAIMMTDIHKVNKALSGKEKMTKTTTYMLLAFMLESGILRFTSGKGRRTADSLVAGVDKFKINGITADGSLDLHDPFNKRHSYYTTAITGQPISELFGKISRFCDESSAGTVLKLRKPTTFGNDDASVTFNDVGTEVVYWLAGLLDKLNTGDFGVSTVVDTIKDHLDNRKRLTEKDIAKYIKDLEKLLSKEQQEEMIKAKDNDAAPIAIPDINPNMLPYGYQWKCINWAISAKRGIIAYDLGLGKTLICILITYIMKKMGTIRGSFIFTKLSIIPGFQREIKKIWPEAVTAVINGGLDKRQEQISEAKRKGADFILMSYAPLSRQMPEIMELLDNNRDYAIFFDEGGALRNKNLMHDTADAILDTHPVAFVLDATPFPNNVLVESHRLVDLLYPNQLGTMRAWRAAHSKVEKTTSDKGREVMVYSELEEMRKKVSPFIFVKKATDEDVEAQLPGDPRIIPEYFEMGPKQSEYYQHAVDMTLEAIVDLIRNPGFKAVHNVLASLIRQRQAAVDPWLFDKSYNYDTERLDLIIDKIEQWIINDPNQGILVGAFFTSIYPKLKSMILERLGDRLESEQIGIYDGSLSLEERDKMEQDFNAGRIKVLLGAFKAAGRGLNIQMNCARAIIVHKPYNPDDVKQFIGRINRQGQKKSHVDIYELIATSTIDERIEDILFRKEAEQEEMLSGNEMRSKTGGMTIEEIAGLAGVDVTKVRQRMKASGVKEDYTIKIGD